MKELRKLFNDQSVLQSIKLGLFFFILFTSYMSFQNIVTHIYQQQNLTSIGPLNLIFNYLTFLISNTLAVKCRLSFKTQLIIGSLAYSFNMSTGIFVGYLDDKFCKYLIVIMGGVVGGISAGFLWVSMGGYLREAAKQKDNKGKYSAIFNFCLSMSFLTAGITTTFLLGFFSNQIYFIALTSLSLLSSIFGICFLKKGFTQISDDKLNQSLSIPASIISALKFYSHMFPILLIMIIDGLCLGIQSNQMTKLIPKGEDSFRLKAGVLTIFIGVGSIISSYFTGFLTDKIGLKSTSRVMVGMYVFTCILTALRQYLNLYYFACGVSFLWGFTYYMFQIWIYVMILKLYKGKLEAFAINKQVHCLSMAGFQIFVTCTENKFQLEYLMAFALLLMIPAFISLNWLNFNQYQKQEKVLNQQSTKSLMSQQNQV